MKQIVPILGVLCCTCAAVHGGDGLLGGLFGTSGSFVECGDVVGCGDTCTDPCDLACGDGCGEGCGESCGAGLFGGLGLRKSDHCFDEFISPITNPVYFEDPRNLTEARFIYLNHSIPQQLGGSRVHLFALQVRASLTENLSLIATKDGYVVSDNPLIDDGWADLAAGLKYTLYRDVCSQTLLSVGGRYELPSGQARTLQGNGDGVFNIFLSGGTEIADGMHLLTSSGYRLPLDTDAENQSWYWSGHIDKELGDSGFYLLGEMNWYHWMSDANAFPVAVEGLDLFNLGSTGVEGNDIVTAAFGVKFKPCDNTELGVAWEVPATDRRDILDDRITFDWIIRY